MNQRDGFIGSPTIRDGVEGISPYYSMGVGGYREHPPPNSVGGLPPFIGKGPSLGRHRLVGFLLDSSAGVHGEF